MKAEYAVYSVLEDIHFKYERLESLIGVLQMFVGEVIEIAGAPDNAVEYSLYEIEMGMRENNEKLKEIICNGEVIEKGEHYESRENDH